MPASASASLNAIETNEHQPAPEVRGVVKTVRFAVAVRLFPRILQVAVRFSKAFHSMLAFFSSHLSASLMFRLMKLYSCLRHVRSSHPFNEAVASDRVPRNVCATPSMHT